MVTAVSGFMDGLWYFGGAVLHFVLRLERKCGANWHYDDVLMFMITFWHSLIGMVI